MTVRCPGGAPTRSRGVVAIRGLTEPGLQAGDRLPIIPSMFSVRMRRGAIGAGLLVLAACAPAPVRRPVASPVPAIPVPAAAEPVVAPAPARYAMPGVIPAQRYAVQSVATIERDSVGRVVRQRLESSGQVTVRMERTRGGGWVGAGQIQGYRLRSPLASAPVVLDSVRFDAVLDEAALRVVSRPPLVNECDAPETGALALARELFWRVPSTVSVGATWRDSTVQLVCRSGLPLVVRTVHQYAVTGATGSGDGANLQLQRTDSTRLEGKGSSPWRALEVTGSGRGQWTAQLAVRTGVLSQLRGESTVTLRLADRSPAGVSRVEEVRQLLRLTADWQPD